MMRRKLLLFLLSFCGLVFLLTGVSFAAPLATLEVCPTDLAGESIQKIYIQCCCVATPQGEGYAVEEAFAGADLSAVIADPETAAQTLYETFVQSERLPARQSYAAEGKAVFEDLEAGIWLVWCPEGQPYRFNPFIVRFGAEGGIMISHPKGEPDAPYSKSIQVFKKWADSDNAAGKRPKSIIVELLEGGKVIATASLSGDTGWSHTFANLEKETAYSVREQAVEGYSSAIQGNETDGFTITNTYLIDRLPQTGQHWWPIGLMALAGVAMVVLGIYELKERKGHGA